MRSVATLLALATLPWSQLVALRCDAGAATPAVEAAPATLASAHEAGDHTHQPAPVPASHDHLPVDGTATTPHGEHHGETDGCPMIVAACGAAPARTVQTAILVRLPAAFVRSDFFAAPVPALIPLGVETPPPRHHA